MASVARVATVLSVVSMRMRQVWPTCLRRKLGRRQNARLCADLDVIKEDVPRTALGHGGVYRAATAEELTAVLEAHVVAESRREDGMGCALGNRQSAIGNQQSAIGEWSGGHAISNQGVQVVIIAIGSGAWQPAMLTSPPSQRERCML
jgi:hypothetical protein